jgi:hypothetical protein
MNPVFCGAQRKLANLLDVVCRPLPATLASRWLTCLAMSSTVMLTGLLLASTAWAGPPDAPSGQRSADVKQQLTQARKRLDEAALELARLHETVAMSAQQKGGGRAMLGVIIDQPKRRDGAFISGVTPGGGAAAAGLKSGDVLIAIEGQAMDGSQGLPHLQISQIMQGVTAGNTVAVRYRRNGSVADAKIVTQASDHYAASLAGLDHDHSDKQRIEIDMDCLEPEALLQELSNSLGVDFDDVAKAMPGSSVMRMDSTSPHLVDLTADLAHYFDTDSGVLVISVPDGNSSLKAGDVVDQVAGTPITDVQDALSKLHLSDGDQPIKLQVIRQGKTQQVSIQPGLLSVPNSQVIRLSGDAGELRIELSRTPPGRTNLAP